MLRGMVMSATASARMGTVAFLAILTVSAGSMLWLFWRFPLMTAVVTLGVFAALVLLARLARSIDADLQDLDRTEQSI